MRLFSTTGKGPLHTTWGPLLHPWVSSSPDAKGCCLCLGIISAGYGHLVALLAQVLGRLIANSGVSSCNEDPARASSNPSRLGGLWECPDALGA